MGNHLYGTEMGYPHTWAVCGYILTQVKLQNGGHPQVELKSNKNIVQKKIKKISNILFLFTPTYPPICKTSKKQGVNV